MKRPTFRVLEYRHSQTHPWYLDLRPFNRGRKFFKTKAEAEAERLRQITTLERDGREAIGLPPGELSAIVEARKKLARHGKTIEDAAAFYLDYLERIRRCNVTVSDLAKEVLEAKRKDGMSATYIADLKKRLAKFSADFRGTPNRRNHCRRTRQLVARSGMRPQKPGKFPRKHWCDVLLRGAPESDRQQSGSANCTAKACR